MKEIKSKHAYSQQRKDSAIQQTIQYYSQEIY